MPLLVGSPEKKGDVEDAEDAEEEEEEDVGILCVKGLGGLGNGMGLEDEGKRGVKGGVTAGSKPAQATGEEAEREAAGILAGLTAGRTDRPRARSSSGVSTRSPTRSPTSSRAASPEESPMALLVRAVTAAGTTGEASETLTGASMGTTTGAPTGAPTGAWTRASTGPRKETTSGSSPFSFLTGYLHKHDSSILAAIRRICGGELWLKPRELHAFLSFAREGDDERKVRTLIVVFKIKNVRCITVTGDVLLARSSREVLRDMGGEEGDGVLEWNRDEGLDFHLMCWWAIESYKAKHWKDGEERLRKMGARFAAFERAQDGRLQGEASADPLRHILTYAQESGRPYPKARGDCTGSRLTARSRRAILDEYVRENLAAVQLITRPSSAKDQPSVAHVSQTPPRQSKRRAATEPLPKSHGKRKAQQIVDSMSPEERGGYR